MSRLAGWGGFPKVESEVAVPFGPRHMPEVLKDRRGYVARGAGRAYGDAAIGSRSTVLTQHLNRFQSFEPLHGLLRVEAGVRLSEIIAVSLPRGYFPMVVPGTQHVTVGGMIAADVHGKNHHRDGGFGAHVHSLTLLSPDGRSLTASREDNPALFAATIGGMGLTGTIVDATLRLRAVESGWMLQHTEATADLSGTLRALSDSDGATYSVAWVDALSRGAHLGRGLVYRGEHASADDCQRLLAGRGTAVPPRRAPLTVPFNMPSWTLNPLSMRAFNHLYYRLGVRSAKQRALVPWMSYFFPLDGVANWNRLYGARGFVQYQCVVPSDAAHVLAEILARVAHLGTASPLAVLKQLGPGAGVLSFPMAGVTLALDLPATTDTFALLDALDPIVVQAGGRFYLAKDARQSRDTFERSYPTAPRFRQLRREMSLAGVLESKLSERLAL